MQRDRAPRYTHATWSPARALSMINTVSVKALARLLASLATLAVKSRVASIASKPASSGFDCKLYVAHAKR